MAYLTSSQIEQMNFKHIGSNIKISERAVIQNPELVSIGDNSRIDDFCVVSGITEIGRNVHLAVYSHVSGGQTGVTLEDFSGLAFGVHVIAESDDYSGESLTNPTVPRKYKKPILKPVHLGKHVIVGAQTVILPGVSIGTGSAVGALSLVVRSIPEWGIYSGIPVKKLKDRSKSILNLEAQLLAEES